MPRLFKYTSIILFLSILQMLTLQVNAASVSNKKLTFFESIYPLIERENISILRTRDKIISVKKKLITNKALLASEKTWLTVLAKKYRLLKNKDDMTALVNRLLVNVDIIPPSLALAQSANESAWGTSRFARVANNYFGQWCFSKGCGIIPAQRSASSRHEVKSFNSAQESVRGYIKNINSLKSYATLRKIRHQSRIKSVQPDGHTLAKGLLKYSSRGNKYVNEIQKMIKQNNLITYDERFWLLMKKIKLNRSI
jgi:Bax protein